VTLRLENTLDVPADYHLMSCSWWDNFKTTNSDLTLDLNTKMVIDGKTVMVSFGCGANYPIRLMLDPHGHRDWQLNYRLVSKNKKTGTISTKFIFSESTSSTLDQTKAIKHITKPISFSIK
jgi:hypothetical protein